MILLLAHTFNWLYIYSLNNVTFTFSKFTYQNRFINLTHLSTPNRFNDLIGFINAWFAIYIWQLIPLYCYILLIVFCHACFFLISFVVNNNCDISRRCCDIYRQRIFFATFPVNNATYTGSGGYDVFSRLRHFPATVRHFP